LAILFLKLKTKKIDAWEKKLNKKKYYSFLFYVTVTIGWEIKQQKI